jgi:DNA-binding NarL/FixJ family response regulator
MNPPVRILVADHHPPSRKGIRAALQGKGFDICAEAVDAAAAAEAARRERPAVCLLEVALPGDGLAAATEIASSMPETSIVMLAGSPEESDMLAALRNGACGYLLKSMDSKRLPFALHGVLKGEAALPRTMVARLIAELRRHHRPGTGSNSIELSEREWEVLDRVRDGHSTAAIASALSISPVTVRRHVSNILSALGVPDRESALRLTEGS